MFDMKWRYRIADEYRDVRGPIRKTWWLLRFAVGLAVNLVFPSGGLTFGIAALGDNDAKMRRAIKKARESDSFDPKSRA